MVDAVTLGEFAQLVGTSEPTLRKRIAEAPPGVVLEAGRIGGTYRIDPRAGVAWWQSELAADEQRRQLRSDQINALQLELLGEAPALAAHQMEGLTPGEQQAQLQAELLALKLGVERGELVRATEVAAIAGAFMLAVKGKLESLPERLRKRAEVPADVAETLARLIDRDLHDLADGLEAGRMPGAE